MSTSSRPRRSAPTAARLTEPGKDSPYSDRSVEENLGPVRAACGGEFPDGEHVSCGPRSTWPRAT